MIKEIYDIFENLKKQGKKDDDFKIDFLATEILNFKDEIDKLNIYEKVNLIKLCILKLKLDKTGEVKTKNEEIKYYYFTLDKLEPPIIILSNILDLNLKISCEKDDLSKIKLIILNTKNTDEYIDHCLPFPYKFLENINNDIRMLASQNIQNLGATTTYMRRYLILTAFDIIEPDEIEIGNDESTNKTNNFSKNKQKRQYNLNNDNLNNDNEKIKSEPKIESFEGYFLGELNSFTSKKGQPLTNCAFKNGATDEKLNMIVNETLFKKLKTEQLYELSFKKYGNSVYLSSARELKEVEF